MTGYISRKVPKKAEDADTSVSVDAEPESPTWPGLPPTPNKSSRPGCCCGRCLLCTLGLTVTLLLLAAAVLLFMPHTSSSWLGLGRTWSVTSVDDFAIEWKSVKEEMHKLQELGSFAGNILYLGGLVPAVTYRQVSEDSSINNGRIAMDDFVPEIYISSEDPDHPDHDSVKDLLKTALHIDEKPALASSKYHREHTMEEYNNLSEVEGLKKSSEGQKKPSEAQKKSSKGQEKLSEGQEKSSEGKEKRFEGRKSSEGQELAGSGKEIMSSIDKIVLATKKAQAKLASLEDN